MEKDRSYSDDTFSTKYRWIQDSQESMNALSVEDGSAKDSSFLDYEYESPKLEKIHQLARLLDDTQMSTKTIKKETTLRTTESFLGKKQDIKAKMHSPLDVQKPVLFSDDQLKTVSSFDKHADSQFSGKTPLSSRSLSEMNASKVQNNQSFLEPSLLNQESSGVSNSTAPSPSSIVFSKKGYQEVPSQSSILPKQSPNQSETSSSFSWSSETVKEYLNEILKQIYSDKKENIRSHKSNYYKHFSNSNTSMIQENAALFENGIDEKSYISKKSESILDLMKEKLFLDAPAPNLYTDVPENHCVLKVSDQPESFSNEKAHTSSHLMNHENSSSNSFIDTHHISNKNISCKDFPADTSNKSYNDEKKSVEVDFKQINLCNISDNQKNQNCEVQYACEDYTKYREDIVNIQNSLKQLVNEYDRRGHMLDKLINEFSILKSENKNQSNESILKTTFEEAKKHAVFVEKDLDAARLEINDLKTICHDLIEALKIKPQNIQKYYPSTPKAGNEESLKEKMTRWKTYLSPQFSPIQTKKSSNFAQNSNIYDKKEPLHDLNTPINIQSPMQKTLPNLDKKETAFQEFPIRQSFEGDNQISSYEEIYNLKIQLEKAEQEIERLKSIIPNTPHEHHTKPITPQDMPDAHKPLSKAEKIYYRLQLYKIDKLCSNETSNLLKNILVQLNIPFDSLPETITSIRYRLQQSLRLREFAEEVHLSLYEGEPMDPKLVSKKCLGDMITKVDQLARSSRRRRIRRSII